MPCYFSGDLVVCSPTLDHKSIRAGTCPDCGKWTRFLQFSYEWYGTDATCLRCGRVYSDGERMPLEFSRFARRDSIAEAKRAWRRHREG